MLETINHQQQNKIILCFAWRAEANPFIKISNAKLTQQNKKFKFYTSPSTDIIITGVGAFNMSAAMGWIQQFIKDIAVYWNIGFCAGQEQNIFSWFRIIKVSYQDNMRDFYPEIETKSPLPFATLRTVNSPVNNKHIENLGAELVDMEAYGFCKGLQPFHNSSFIQILKWVSDNGIENFDKTAALKQYENSIEQVFDYIVSQSEEIINSHKNNLGIINPILEQTKEKLSLSFTRTHQLKDALRFALYYKGETFIHKEVTSINNDLETPEKKVRTFNQLIKKLTHV